MTEPKDGTDREDVLRSLTESEQANLDLAKTGGELLRHSTHQVDLIRATKAAIEVIPPTAPIPGQLWKDAQTVLQAQTTQARQAQSQIRSALTSYAISSSGNTALATGLTSTVAFSETTHLTGPSWYNERFLPRVTVLNEVVQQDVTKQKVEQLLKELQLDKDIANIKSPLNQIQEAYGALNQLPPELTTGTSALVPLRECINSALAMLLKRLPHQIPSGRKLSEKILCIASQCARDGVDPNHFIHLGRLADRLHRIYSDSKDKQLLREEVLTHFNAGVAALNSFLVALDPSRFRSVD